MAGALALDGAGCLCSSDLAGEDARLPKAAAMAS
jgi:hypothetical protein